VATTADEIVVIGHGRLLASGSVAELTGSGGSLENAFFELTAGSVDYRAGGA
jgi:ABC-2 type transport system ATP-binding protein